MALDQLSRPRSVRFDVQGDISGQVAIGSHIVQIRADHGAVVNYTLPRDLKPPSPRSRPVLLLPRTPAGLVDRVEEIEAAFETVTGASVLEFTGEEGIGKSAVLRHVINEAAHVLPDGAIYIPSADQPAEDLLQTLFELLYEVDDDFKPTPSELRTHLQHQRLLVVLDDLNGSRRAVQELTDALPASALLVGSVEPGLWGAGEPMALGPLPEDDAISLLQGAIGRPLTSRQVETARKVCRALGQRPLAILQAATAVREDGISLGALLRQIRLAPVTTALAEVSKGSLSGLHRAVLGLLGGMGGTPIDVEHIGAIVESWNVHDIVDDLARRHLVEIEGDLCRAANARLAAQLGSMADDLMDRALQHLTTWAQQHLGDRIAMLGVSPSLQAVQRWAAAKGRWEDVGRVGRTLEQALALGRKWGAWQAVLHANLEAASRLQDRPAEAMALHQLGTRALSLGDRRAARGPLRRALRIRRSLGDEAGAAVTRNNLRFTRPWAPPGGPARWSPDRWLVPRGLGWKLLGPLAGLLGLILFAFATCEPPPVTSVARPALSISPPQLVFQDQYVGTMGAPQTVHISNSGKVALRIDRVRVIGDDRRDFDLVEPCTDRILNPGELCDVEVRSAPIAEGQRIGLLEVAYGDQLRIKTIPVRGVGKRDIAPPPHGPFAVVSPVTISFPDQQVNTISPGQDVTVSNAGEGHLMIHDAAIIGDDRRAFSIQESTCDGVSLASGESCRIVVAFQPPNTGDLTEFVQVDHNDGARNPSVVHLEGVGVGPPPPPPRLPPLGFAGPAYVDAQRSGASPVVLLAPDGSILLAADAGASAVPHDPKAVAGTGDFATGFSAQSNVWRSMDGGVRWTHVGVGGGALGHSAVGGGGSHQPDLTVHSSGTIFGTESRKGNASVFWSYDDGRTFRGQNLLAGPGGPSWVTATPSGDLFLLVERPHRLYRSMDEGESFQLVSHSPLPQGKVVADPKHFDVLISPDGHGGVAISSDRGKTWNDRPRAFGVATAVPPAVAVDPSGRIYAAVATGYHGPKDTTPNGQVMLAWLDGETDRTWSSQIRIPIARGDALWASLIAGADGRVAVAWYQNLSGHPNTFYVFAAYTETALEGIETGSDGSTTVLPPFFRVANASGRPVHVGPICLAGLNCDTSSLQQGDARLGDHLSIAADEDGRILIAAADTMLNSNLGGPKQVSNPIFLRQARGELLFPPPSSSGAGHAVAPPIPLAPRHQTVVFPRGRLVL